MYSPTNHIAGETALLIKYSSKKTVVKLTHRKCTHRANIPVYFPTFVKLTRHKCPHRAGEVARNGQRVGGNGRDEERGGAGSGDEGDDADAGRQREVGPVAAHHHRRHDGRSAVERNQCC